GFDGRRGLERKGIDAYILMLIGAMDTPIYLAIPVQDEKIVDEFLDKLDPLMAKVVRFDSDKVDSEVRFKQDFYKTRLANGSMTGRWRLQMGRAKGRLHYARIGNAFYIATKATKRPILEDIALLEKARGKEKAAPADDPEANAHVMLRIRANNWNEI